NLVNNMDRTKFDISVTALFGGGVNEQFLKPHIHYRAVFPREIPGNSRLMKLLTPKQLHRLCVREHYDIEVSYLEGPSARVISGCQAPDTKLVCWIHSTLDTIRMASASFRSPAEARWCYGRFNRIICVSKWTRQVFENVFPEISEVSVLYNTVESEKILELSRTPLPAEIFRNDRINLMAMGTMKPVKGFDRLIRIHGRLRGDGYPVHTWILGRGPELENLRQQAQSCGCGDSVSFLGYDTNPYKYLSRSDLFICSSWSEGFSTAATEALIVGTPVCTVEVSGMKEMLGENNEYGIVTANDEEALYQGIRSLLDDPALLAHYKQQAARRGRDFSTEETVRAVEKMLLSL
ncbi:MAG: glycosyltransferase, partial [Oscillospiraceae bacterium]|nr:glycosyltransferase [Oscillospiraceae bacterium]